MSDGIHVAVRPRFYADEQIPQPSANVMQTGTGHTMNPQPVNMQSGVNQMSTQSVNTVNAQHAPAVPSAQDTSKGFFNTIYDNKIIVLIIVIIIIIIALIAYAVYRREDPEPPRPRARRTNNPTGNTAGGDGLPHDNINDAQQPHTPTEVAAVPKQTPEELMKLLEKGRAAAATTTAGASDSVTPADTNVTTQSESFDDSKSEDEILSLMVDGDVQENEQTPTEYMGEPSNAVVVSTHSQETTSEGSTDSAPAVDTTAQTKLDPTTCSVLVKGRQCKNKLKDNGKCAAHLKST